MCVAGYVGVKRGWALNALLLGFLPSLFWGLTTYWRMSSRELEKILDFPSSLRPHLLVVSSTCLSVKKLPSLFIQTNLRTLRLSTTLHLWTDLDSSSPTLHGLGKECPLLKNKYTLPWVKTPWFMENLICHYYHWFVLLSETATACGHRFLIESMNLIESISST